jgi:hypothetical protein
MPAIVAAASMEHEAVYLNGNTFQEIPPFYR